MEGKNKMLGKVGVKKGKVAILHDQVIPITFTYGGIRHISSSVAMILRQSDLAINGFRSTLVEAITVFEKKSGQGKVLARLKIAKGVVVGMEGELILS